MSGTKNKDRKTAETPKVKMTPAPDSLSSDAVIMKKLGVKSPEKANISSAHKSKNDACNDGPVDTYAEIEYRYRNSGPIDTAGEQKYHEQLSPKQDKDKSEEPPRKPSP